MVLGGQCKEWNVDKINVEETFARFCSMLSCGIEVFHVAPEGKKRYFCVIFSSFRDQLLFHWIQANEKGERCVKQRQFL